jgi:hypothetical protein
VVELFASNLVNRELNKIPQQYRAQHSLIYCLVADVPLVPSHRRVPPFTPIDFPFGMRPQPLLMRLSNILPDQPDAEHVFQAAMNGLGYVITVDGRP